jgi:hypothetical protein
MRRKRHEERRRRRAVSRIDPRKPNSDGHYLRLTGARQALAERPSTPPRATEREDAAAPFHKIFKNFLDHWCRYAYLRLPLGSVRVLGVG